MNVLKRTIFLAITVIVSALIVASLLSHVRAAEEEQVYSATALTFANIDDAVAGPINLNFTFPYFGTEYTQAYGQYKRSTYFWYWGRFIR